MMRLRAELLFLFKSLENFKCSRNKLLHHPHSRWSLRDPGGRSKKVFVGLMKRQSISLSNNMFYCKKYKEICCWILLEKLR